MKQSDSTTILVCLGLEKYLKVLDTTVMLYEVNNARIVSQLSSKRFKKAEFLNLLKGLINWDMFRFQFY